MDRRECAAWRGLAPVSQTLTRKQPAVSDVLAPARAIRLWSSAAVHCLGLILFRLFQRFSTSLMTVPGGAYPEILARNQYDIGALVRIGRGEPSELTGE